MSQKRIAIVRVRGSVNLKADVADTLKMLRLYKNNTCTIIANNPTYFGMLKKVKDFVTWGEVDEETFKQMLLKRGKLPANQRFNEAYLKDKTKMTLDAFSKEFFAFKKEIKDVPGLKTFFTLNPPAKGFERKGIKTPFSLGGALGYRKDRINDLLRRMM